MSMVHASCLCGDVAWEVDGPMQFMSHCHCLRCRKATGGAFFTAVMLPADALRFTRGRDRVGFYASTPAGRRPFCVRCGSTVASDEPYQGMVGVPAGPFDEDPGVRPIAHIFVGSKAPWYDITGDVARFDTYPPGVDAPAYPDLERMEDRGRGVRGSCLCGAVRFVVEGNGGVAQHCHCTRCRRARGTAHASNMFVPLDAVRFTAGEERLAEYKVPEARFFKQVFCKTCGSPMPRRDPERGLAFVPMGALDDDPGVRPGRHIYVGSKAPWFDITDDLPRFETMPT